MRVIHFVRVFGVGLFFAFGLFWFFTNAAPGTTFGTVRSIVGWTAVVSLLFGLLFGVVADALHESKRAK